MYNRFRFSVIPVIMLVSAFFFSCSKSSDVGKIIIPPDYLMKTTAQDTFQIIAQTYRVDSLSTENITYAQLGSYKDPIFGDFKASFITEISRSAIPAFDTIHTFDSIKLFLTYDTTYINPALEQEINIAQLTKRLYADSTYYSDFNPSSVNPQLIYSTKFAQNKDTILAIKLPYTFGKKLFDDAKTWKDTTFSYYFNGLYIYSNPGVLDASITRFNLSSQNTKMTLYYHNHNDALSDTLKYNFIISSNGVRFNMFEHNFQGTVVQPVLDNPKVEKELVYLQGAGGLKVKIDVPSLDKLNKKGEYEYGVSRAELIINVDPATVSEKNHYPTPQYIELYYIKDDGTLEYLSEYLTQNYQYLYSEYYNDQFVFDITFLAQKIISGKKKNNGFMLIVRDSKNEPSRVVLTSGKHANPMKLKLTLTKLVEE